MTFPCAIFPRWPTLLLEGLLVLAVAALTLALALWDERLRRSEMRRRARRLQQLLDRLHDRCRWLPEHYPHIHRFSIGFPNRCQLSYIVGTRSLS